MSNRWHVQLGEGGRRMTDSQIKTAAERCWIDAETPVRKPQSSEWTKLGDVAPAKRITEERAAADDSRDIDTSAMILLSGEFELVEEGTEPAPRPSRVGRKLLVLGLAMLAGGGLLAHRYVPRFDAELSSLVSAMRPAPMPTPVVAVVAVAPSAPTPAIAPAIAPTMRAPTPKMQAPTPKMREPSPPPSEAAAPKPKVTHAKPKNTASDKKARVTTRR